MTRPARAIFNPAAVRANLDLVHRTAPGARVLAIVKADAYGHGVVRVARALGEVDALGVASVEEAVRLREAGIARPIVLLEGPFEASELTDIAIHRLESVVHNAEQQAWFERQSVANVLWIKIDTGMHRLGFTPAAARRAVLALQRPGRELRLMTHLASAHVHGAASVTQQLQIFLDAVGDLQAARSVANSGAILSLPPGAGEWVRPGLMLYGVSPFEETSGSSLGLQPAMTITSALIAVKTVAAGGAVGYAPGYVCPVDMPIGVVAFGYADGYPRHAATGTPVLVNGIRTQVLGAATMDMLMVDLRPIPGARVGDPVVLWGAGLPVEEIARAAGTIPYELLCRMHMRAQCVELSA